MNGIKQLFFNIRGVEHYLRYIKKRIDQGLIFMEFEEFAKRTINGLELVYMIRKNQFTIQDGSRFRIFCKMVAYKSTKFIILEYDSSDVTEISIS